MNMNNSRCYVTANYQWCSPKPEVTANKLSGHNKKKKEKKSYIEFRCRVEHAHYCLIEEEKDGKPWYFDIK